jgi:CheY-like chemotaxis protein
MLAKIGARFDTVANGGDALEFLARHRYDLVLMDLQMPGISGFETTERLKSDSRFSLNLSTPVVALTAHATKEHRERCFEVGMSDYLTKPLRLKEIRAVVKKWGATRIESSELRSR